MTRGERDAPREPPAAEEASRFGAERYRQLVESSAEGISVLRDGVVEYANAAMARIVGLEDVRQLLGRAVLDFVAPERRDEVRARLAALAAGGVVAPLDLTLVRPDGVRVEVTSSPNPFRDERGPAVQAVVRDVTEQVRVAREEARRAREYEAILESSMDAIVFLDPDGTIRDVNPAACALTGYGRDELLGMKVDDIAVPSFPGEREARTRGALETGRVRFESRMRRRDGNVLDVEVSMQRVSGGSGLVAFVRDVTARKRTESELGESEERFRVIAEAAPVGIFVSALDGTARYVNPEGQRIIGRSGEDALGRAWLEVVHPEDRERIATELLASIAAESAYRNEFRILRASDEVALIQTHAAPRRDASGAISGFVGVIVDVSEQRRTEQRFAVASRLAALGTLVAGVGHEINNPLAGMMAGEGFVLDVLQDLLGRLRSPAPPSSGEVAAELDGAVEPLRDGLESGARIAQIVKDLAVFGGSRATGETFPLREAVDAALRWLPASLGAAPRVEVDDRGAPDVRGLRGQIAQVVLNLLSNACKAGLGGAAPHVTVRLRPGEPGRAVVEVEDDGVGMTREVQERIFDPFFTTRPAGDRRGTGLGLSLCQAIVNAHGGTIAVRSEPGRGSTFTVDLPAASPTACTRTGTPPR